MDRKALSRTSSSWLPGQVGFEISVGAQDTGLFHSSAAPSLKACACHLPLASRLANLRISDWWNHPLFSHLSWEAAEGRQRGVSFWNDLSVPERTGQNDIAN